MSESSLARIIDGYRTTTLVYAAVRLGIPDMLGAEGNRSSVLAKEAGWSAQALYRFLRVLASIGICDETPPDTFRLTGLGRELTSQSTSGAREQAILAVEQYWPAWRGLEHTVRSGEPAFDKAFAMTPWEYREAHPESGHVFNTWLARQTSAVARGVAKTVDFSAAQVVADIGGGNGGLLRELLEHHPHLHGILFDQPHVTDRLAEKAGLMSGPGRLTLQGGDFFDQIDIEADIYLLKSVLHDWSDRDAAGILRNCRACMPPGARLLIIERVSPELAADDISTVMVDLHMMLVTGGRERKLAEFEKLLGQEAFSVVSVSQPTDQYFAIEARPS